MFFHSFLDEKAVCEALSDLGVTDSTLNILTENPDFKLSEVSDPNSIVVSSGYTKINEQTVKKKIIDDSVAEMTHLNEVNNEEEFEKMYDTPDKSNALDKTTDHFAINSSDISSDFDNSTIQNQSAQNSTSNTYTTLNSLNQNRISCFTCVNSLVNSLQKNNFSASRLGNANSNYTPQKRVGTHAVAYQYPLYKAYGSGNSRMNPYNQTINITLNATLKYTSGKYQEIEVNDGYQHQIIRFSLSPSVGWDFSIKNMCSAGVSVTKDKYFEEMDTNASIGCTVKYEK